LLLGAAVGVVALAAFLRLWHLEDSVFGIDEAALVRLAEDIVRGGQIPLSGPITSIGLPSAPHFIYAIAPVVAISRDPAFVSGAIAVANLAGVVGTLWLGWRWFGPTAGLIAALLYAVSPWAVAAARRIWQPDLLPPLAVFFFVALDLGVLERALGDWSEGLLIPPDKRVPGAGRSPPVSAHERAEPDAPFESASTGNARGQWLRHAQAMCRVRHAWWAAATLPILAFGILVHPAFALLAPFAVLPVIALLLARRFLPLLVAIVASGFIAAPTVLHEIQTRWIDIPNYRYYASLNAFVDPESLRYALILATDWNAPHEASVPPVDHVFPAWLVLVTTSVATALLLFSLAIVVIQLVRRTSVSRVLPRWAAPLLVLVWLVLPVVALIRHNFPLQAHYLLVMYPAAFLIVGAAYAAVAHVGWLRTVVLTGVAATAVLNGAGVLAGEQHVSVAADACYGPSLQTAEATAQEVVTLASQAQGSYAAIELNAADALPTAYLVRGSVPRVDLAGVGSVGLGVPSLAAGADQLRLLTGTGPRDLTYADGVHLVGVAYAPQPEPDQRVHFAIVWNTGTGAPPNRPLVWNVLLQDDAGKTFYKGSGVDHLPGVSGDQALVSWFSLDPPQPPDPPLSAGSYAVRVQLVDAFDSTPVPFRDADGTSATDWTISSIPIAPPIRCS
jgi:hypothetical protein